jgi:hypothetical protein
VQVLNMVHAKGQQTLEEKRNQYKNDISEILDIQSTLEQEVQDKMMSDQTTKLQNRQVAYSASLTALVCVYA